MPTLDILPRLSLDTAITLDLTPYLSPLQWATNAYLVSLADGVDTRGVRVDITADNVITLFPTERGPALMDNPEAPNGTPVELVVTVWDGEDIRIPLLGALPTTDRVADMRGTSGQDTLVLDASGTLDPGTARVIDTSGGSDRAAVLGAAAILLGRAGDDSLAGWDLADALYGGGGQDRLFGLGGHDRLLGMNGHDSLFGGAGFDLLYGGAGNDLLDGGEGDDMLISGTGRDTVRGGFGNDLLRMSEGSGNDVIAGSGEMLAYGGDGDDLVYDVRTFATLHGGAGNDTLSADMLVNSVIYGGDGDESISGGTMSDQMIAESGITALPDTTTFYGGAGNDTIYGYGARMEIAGGTGNDRFMGWGEFWGGAGDDHVSAYLASTVFGGTGNDTIEGYGGANILHGGGGDDSVVGGSGGDALHGGLDNDTLHGGEGLDTLYGGAGNDLLTATDSTMVSVPAGQAGDTLYGGTGDDTLLGSRAGNALYGDEGNDLLHIDGWGSNFQDTSTLSGGDGDDRLIAVGLSQATGGAGNDTFVVQRAGAGVPETTMTILDFVRGEDQIDVDVYGLSVDDLVFRSGGAGPADFLGSISTLTWQSASANSVWAFVDANGDGNIDASFMITGISNLTVDDIAFMNLA